MNNIMLDLETMGNSSHSAIIAIGAVYFDEEGHLGQEFYNQVSLQSSVDLGLNIDPSTVLWWIRQSEGARKAFIDNEKAPHINQVLVNFLEFCGTCPRSKLKVWGNGAGFDNVILRNAYELTHCTTPWVFWNDRCYRTLKNLFFEIQPSKTNDHNALADAINQAEHASRILQYIKSRNETGKTEPRG